jgi:hypothetical protein
MSSNNIRVNLTETENEVLGMLHDLGCSRDRWLRPMDVGRPSSRVQRGLAGLTRKGLVERKHRPASTAWLYQLTEAGRVA